MRELCLVCTLMLGFLQPPQQHFLRGWLGVWGGGEEIWDFHYSCNSEKRSLYSFPFDVVVIFGLLLKKVEWKVQGRLVRHTGHFWAVILANWKVCSRLPQRVSDAGVGFCGYPSLGGYGSTLEPQGPPGYRLLAMSIRWKGGIGYGTNITSCVSNRE